MLGQPPAPESMISFEKQTQVVIMMGIGEKSTAKNVYL
jgi:hypothetical protein